VAERVSRFQAGIRCSSAVAAPFAQGAVDNAKSFWMPDEAKSVEEMYGDFAGTYEAGLLTQGLA
jgi:hypothetical protein